jgi:hypothetical protein
VDSVGNHGCTHCYPHNRELRWGSSGCNPQQHTRYRKTVAFVSADCARAFPFRATRVMPLAAVPVTRRLRRVAGCATVARRRLRRLGPRPRPTAEVKEPQRTIPFALACGLAGAAVLYVLTQLVTLATIGMNPTDRPVADTASVLMGRTGGLFVTAAVLLSTYGNISACILNAPRIVYALAENRDARTALGKLHPQFRTPARALLLYALSVWLLAASGTFVWVLALGAGSLTVLYGSVCACLFKLRGLNPGVQSLRVPAGRILAISGIAISALLLTRLEPGQFLLMGATGLGAAANWWWATKRIPGSSQGVERNEM